MRLVDKYKGDLGKAAAGYNGGEGAVARAERKAKEENISFRDALPQGQKNKFNNIRDYYDQATRGTKATIDVTNSLNDSIQYTNQLETIKAEKLQAENEKQLELAKLAKEREDKLREINSKITETSQGNIIKPKQDINKHCQYIGEIKYTARKKEKNYGYKN